MHSQSTLPDVFRRSWLDSAQAKFSMQLYLAGLPMQSSNTSFSIWDVPVSTSKGIFTQEIAKQ